jgi:hypothetical protein
MMQQSNPDGADQSNDPSPATPELIQDTNTSPKAHLINIPENDNDDIVYVHNLAEDPNMGEGSYSFNQKDGLPRNAYAAMLNPKYSESTAEIEEEVSGQSKGRQASVQRASSPSVTVVTATNNNSKQPSIDSAIQLFSDRSGGRKRNLKKAEKLIKQIQFSKHTGEPTWNGQTQSELLRDEKLQAHSWSNTRRKNYELVLAIMTRIKQKMKRDGTPTSSSSTSTPVMVSQQNFKTNQVIATPVTAVSQQEVKTNQALADPVMAVGQQEIKINQVIDPDLVSLDAGFVSPRVPPSFFFPF